MSERHPATKHVMQFFEYAHLPPHLQAVSEPFCRLAETVADGPQNAETTAALRKLLEAKDCAVRALISKAVMLLAILLPSLAFAATPEEASFRVDIPGAGGSGTGIHPHLVVTNSHVVGHRQRSDVTVESEVTGHKWKAQTVAVRPDYDLCLLWIDEEVPHVEISDMPIRGEYVTLYGYGPDRRLKAGGGRVIGEQGRKPSGAENIETWVQSVPGDSGGGIFDTQQRLVAVNWGGDSNTQTSVSVPAKWVRKIGHEWVTHVFPQSRWQEFG